MRHLDLYERRAEVLALIKSTPLATSNIARLLGQPVNAIVHDISIMSQRGWVIQDGKDEVEYATGMKRYTAGVHLSYSPSRSLSAMHSARMRCKSLCLTFPTTCC